MRIGIDASNIRAGGGLTHLTEVLFNLFPAKFGIDKVIIWASKSTRSKIEKRDWLHIYYLPVLDGSLPRRIWWQQITLPELLRAEHCNVLFSPGGIVPLMTRDRITTITISQNLLPFDDKAIAEYPLSQPRLKLHLAILKFFQTLSFRRADGVIFLTKFAKNSVLEKTGSFLGRTQVIPHGLNPAFCSSPRIAKDIRTLSESQSFRFLYVSPVNYYKHQWDVAEAVGRLRRNGYPVSIDFVGPPSRAYRRLEKTIRKWDPDSSYIRYVGAVEHAKMPEVYRMADAFVFASSCEAFGQILIEAMASGLPIASSDIGAGREILGDSAIYFDARDPASISSELEKLLQDPELRASMSQNNFEKAKQYSWISCADATFQFICQVYSDRN
jgi:glycosyltransferase involved in cell wall biosynthesis